MHPDNSTVTYFLLINIKTYDNFHEKVILMVFIRNDNFTIYLLISWRLYFYFSLLTYNNILLLKYASVSAGTRFKHFI